MISRNLYNADKTKNVTVVNRGRDTGFSGIEKAQIYLDNACMLYGNGQEVKQL